MAKQIRISEPDASRPEENRDSIDAEASREEIARRAYDLYQSRGGEGGRALDDWLRAEQDLREEREQRERGQER